MNNEIAIVEHGNMPMRKEDVLAQKTLVRQVMESVMKDNTHYGVIPGCKQPSLYKAGSEVILSTFRIAVVPNVEDLSTRDCFRYRVTCQGVLPSGEIVGAGIGEASTDEEKYKWRGAICLAEYDNSPEDRRRFKYLKEPTSWNKEGLIRQVRTNPADLANTVLKMAKKRAQIDLTLTCTACSDVFVQDLEDLSDELREELVGTEGQQPQGKPAVSQPKAKPTTATTTAAPQDNGDKATEGQVKMLHVKLRQGNVTEASFNAHYKLDTLADLPKSLVNEAIKAIGEGKIPAAAKAAEPAQDATPVICSDCGMPIVEGACRNMDCPEGKPFEDA